MAMAEEVFDELVPQPSVALYDPLDREQTRLTGWARAALRFLLDSLSVRSDLRADAFPVQFVRIASGEFIVLEVHGQSAVTGHGKQGLRPDRIAFLHELNERGLPVYLVFVEGMTAWRSAWLHDLPEAKPIAKGDRGARETMRYGWHVDKLIRSEGPLVLPGRVSPPKPKVQEALA